MQRLGRGRVHVLVLRLQVLDERRDGTVAAEQLAIFAPLATLSYRLGQIASQQVIVLKEHTIDIYCILSTLINITAI